MDYKQIFTEVRNRIIKEIEDKYQEETNKEITVSYGDGKTFSLIVKERHTLQDITALIQIKEMQGKDTVMLKNKNGEYVTLAIAEAKEIYNVLLVEASKVIDKKDSLIEQCYAIKDDDPEGIYKLCQIKWGVE